MPGLARLRGLLSKNGLDRVLTAATVAVTLIAAAVVAVRFRSGAFDGKPRLGAPTDIAAWREYGRVGLRDGPVQARVTIVNFSDFQCPFCRRASEYFDRLRDKQPSEIAVVYRHFPVHDFATEAAIAAECAAAQGSFDSMRRHLFAQAESIGVKPWRRFASEAGVRDKAAFERCMQSPAVRATIVRDSLAGVSLGMTGTPTLLINGLRVKGFVGDSLMDIYVAEALAAAGIRGLR